MADRRPVDALNAALARLARTPVPRSKFEEMREQLLESLRESQAREASLRRRLYAHQERFLADAIATGSGQREAHGKLYEFEQDHAHG